MRALKCFQKKIKKYFDPENMKKLPSKVAHNQPQTFFSVLAWLPKPPKNRNPVPKEIKNFPQRKFFPFGAPKEVFFPLVPQRKKKCSRGGGQGQFFSTCEKDTQILEFFKGQGGKI